LELRIDLDPTPGVPWADIRRVAMEVKAFLEEIGLQGWPKTSGSRGMHVNVRIWQRWTFSDVRRAALALSREIERRMPGLATSKWWKEERRGVFLDYNQNAKDRTTCSAYSVRPLPDARVSAPLSWEEVSECDPADFTVPPDVGVVHRKLPYSDIYFIANTANRPVKGNAAFRVQGLQAAWWDPFTGKTSKAEMTLDLAPYESRVLVFSKEAAPAIPAMSGSAIPPVDVSTNWSVKFPDAPAMRMSALKPWTDDEARKFYSGTATYEHSVTAPAAMLRVGQRIFLNFGEGAVVDPASERRAPAGMRAWMESPVREAAQVFVNGKPAGAVWKAPFEVEVTGLLKAGDNAIRVVVANLALNVLARDPLPDYKELIAKYGDKFQPQDMVSVRSLPAGMMGPVTLIAK